MQSPGHSSSDGGNAKTAATPMLAPLVRARSAQACAFCRHSKSRCDGVAPCARCVKARVECIFDVREPYQPPSPASSRANLGDATLAHRVALLEERLATVERRDPPAAWLEHRLATLDAEVQTLRQHVGIAPVASTSYLRPAGRMSTSLPNPSPFAHSLTASPASSTLDDASTGSMGPPRKRKSDSSHGSAGTARMSISNLLVHSPEPLRPSTASSVGSLDALLASLCMTEAEVRNLYAIYSDSCVAHLPWLDSPPPFEVARSSPLHIIAACAIAARGTRAADLAETLARATSTQTRTTRLAGKTSLRDLQGLLLEAAYANASSLLIPMVAAARDLGLHDAFAQLSACIRGGGNTEAEIDLVERARLWLVVCAFSSSYSLFTESPLLIILPPEQLVSCCQILQSSRHAHTRAHHAVVTLIHFIATTLRAKDHLHKLLTAPTCDVDEVCAHADAFCAEIEERHRVFAAIAAIESATFVDFELAHLAFMMLIANAALRPLTVEGLQHPARRRLARNAARYAFHTLQTTRPDAYQSCLSFMSFIEAPAACAWVTLYGLAVVLGPDVGLDPAVLRALLACALDVMPGPFATSARRYLGQLDRGTATVRGANEATMLLTELYARKRVDGSPAVLT